jgi:hypothetical protein
VTGFVPPVYPYDQLELAKAKTFGGAVEEADS